MDKEKLLKKLTIKFALEYTFMCSAVFVWMYAFSEGFISPKRWFISSLVIAVMCIGLSIALSSQNQKHRKEMLAIMPMIISIHDTVDSLKKQRNMLSVIQALMFGFGFALRIVNSMFLIISALSLRMAGFVDITNHKIKYLENNPEGMNF